MSLRQVALPIAFVGLVLAVACGEDLVESRSNSEALRPATRILRDGRVDLDLSGTCALAACSVCPSPSFADVIVVGSSTVAVVCYPVQVGRVLRPSTGPVNLNAGTSSMAIDLSGVRTFRGDININSVGSLSVFGSTTTPTLIEGNVNLHAGEVRLYNLIVTGDVSINDNESQSALVDVLVRGNLNVHVENFVGVRTDVFGDFNLNRSRSTISRLSYGENLNIHGAPDSCEDLRSFVDLDGSGTVEDLERANSDDCPAVAGPLPFDLAARFDATGLDVRITGGSGSYDFGMAETGSVFPGWLGEDCLGSDPNFDLCHEGMPASFRLDSVSLLADVVPRTSTLFEALNAGGITFVVYDGPQCYVRGNDPSHYPGCTEL